MNDVVKVVGSAIVGGMLLSLLLYAGDSKLERVQLERFTDQCRTRWADYENRVDVMEIPGGFRATCMVKIDGKWTPEVNVVATP